MGTFTVITNATTMETIKNAISVKPLDRAEGFMPVFTVNCISGKLTVEDRGYYAYYHAEDASDKYLIGFEYKTEIYYGITTSLLFGLIPHINSAKNGGSHCLRFQPSAKIKQALIKAGAVKRICSKSEFNLIVTGYDLNRGQAFEKLLCLNYGLQYHTNSIPYYIKGDLVIDCIDYDIKFEKGNITKRKDK